MKNLNLIVLALFSLFLVSCGSSSSTSTTATGTINNNDTANGLLLSLSNNISIEESGIATITIETNFPATTTDTLSFTATFNVRYDTATTTDFSTTADTRVVTRDITIDTATGNISFVLPISAAADLKIENDDLVEDNETFFLRLTSFEVSHDLFPATTTIDPAKNRITVTIENDDEANLTISTISTSRYITESESIDFVVTLDKATQIELTATYTVQGTGTTPATATDFTTDGATKTVIFLANSSADTTQPFTLETVNNDVISDNKGFFLQFSTNENSLTGDNSTNFLIVDNDNNGVILLAEQTVAEGAAIDLAFLVNQSAFAGDTTTVTVDYKIELNETTTTTATADLADFTNFDATSGTVVLTTAVPQQTITIATAADEIIEKDQSFSVVITKTTPTSVLASTLASNKSRAITIIDDDKATLTLVRDSGNEIAEGVADSTTAATFTVSLASEQTTEIDLDFTITVEGSGDNPTTATDFGGTFPTKSITITAGEDTTNFSISVAGDAALEYNEQFTFTASGANFGSLTISGDVFTIENDDRVTLSVTAVATSVNEAGGNVDFTVSFDGESAIAIPFSYSVTATGDKPVDADDFGGAFPSNTDFIAIDSTTTTINIAIDNDDELEETESFLFSLTASDNELLNNFIDFGTPTAAVDIENDDRVTLSVTAVATSVNEAGGSIDFTVSFTGESAIAIPFSYSVTASGANPVAADDFIGNAFPSSTGSITVGSTSTTISIAINDDNAPEEDETFLLSLSSTNNYVITGTTAVGTIEDDDLIDNNNNGLLDITNSAKFSNIRLSLATGYELLNDLDLVSFPNFEPFGEFTATFDGNGFSIKNLTIDRGSDDNVGLFSRLNGADVRNLIIENPQVTGNDYTGALAGQATNDTLIDNVGVLANSSSSITGNDFVGGLVGRNNTSTINNSWASVSVVGDDNVGGLVGYNFTSAINNSWTAGSVVGSNNVGGLAGYNDSSTINNSWASGSVVGSGNQIGGLVGYNFTSTINNSWASGSVVGDSSVGGLAGYNASTIINNSWAAGSVVGSSTIGGLVGFNITAIISNSYWNTEASGQTTSSGSTTGIFGVTTAEMIAATGAAGTAFNNWNSITGTPWSFGENTEYPTIISNVATADFQLVYQVAGQLRLIPAADTNDTGDAFFANSSLQDELSVTATDFAANSTLAIFDLNAQAENTSDRADFSACMPSTVDDTLLTTNGVNGTTVTVTITADTTNTDWTATAACKIVIGAQPIATDELNLTVKITKGNETATRQFKITFE